MLILTPYPGPTKFRLHYGDLSDSTNLVYIIASVQPSEVYNLGAQSHVKVSFEMAEYTVRVPSQYRDCPSHMTSDRAMWTHLGPLGYWMQFEHVD